MTGFRGFEMILGIYCNSLKLNSSLTRWNELKDVKRNSEDSTTMVHAE